MAGGLGTGTAASAPVATRVKDARIDISRNDGIAENSEESVRGAIVRPSVGEQARVVDSEFAQAFHVEVEFLDAREGPDAHAMQRTFASRDLVQARKLDTRGEQDLDATARVLVIGEYAG